MFLQHDNFLIVPCYGALLTFRLPLACQEACSSLTGWHCTFITGNTGEHPSDPLLGTTNGAQSTKIDVASSSKINKSSSAGGSSSGIRGGWVGGALGRVVGALGLEPSPELLAIALVYFVQVREGPLRRGCTTSYCIGYRR